MFKILLVIISFTITLLATTPPLGEELFIQKCNSCHTLEKQFDRRTVVAPPARNIIFHMNVKFKSKKEKLSHIQKFVFTPSLEKAICPSVRRFGLMPSQKGNLTDKELEVIAQWMIENLNMSNQEHSKMKNAHGYK